jgi:hypothetical protein
MTLLVIVAQLLWMPPPFQLETLPLMVLRVIVTQPQIPPPMPPIPSAVLPVNDNLDEFGFVDRNPTTKSFSRVVTNNTPFDCYALTRDGIDATPITGERRTLVRVTVESSRVNLGF